MARSAGRRRAVLAAALTLAAAIAPARPAAADPARPGDVRSEVTGVTPPAPVTARLRGGDSFLELRVAAGHEAVVLDYDGFAYLRFDPDGTVHENRRSRATYLNRSRDAADEAPADVDPAGPPDWHRVAGGGRYAWHDHRVHWMSPTVAPTQAWRVDLRVDGVPVAVTGRFGPVDRPAAWPWWLGAAVLAAAGFLAARSGARPGAAAAAVAIAVAAPVAAALARLPGATAAEAALVGGAALAAGAAAALRGAAAAALTAGTGMALALWGGRRTAVFGHAVLVTALPAWLDRLAVALALGVGAGLVAGAAWVVVRAPPPPEPGRAIG